VLDLDFIPRVSSSSAAASSPVNSRSFLTVSARVPRSSNAAGNILRDHPTSLDGGAKSVRRRRHRAFRRHEDQASTRRAQYNAHVLHDGKTITRRAAISSTPSAASRTLPAWTRRRRRKNASQRTNHHRQISTNECRQYLRRGDCSGPHEIVHLAIQQGESPRDMLRARKN